MNNIKAWETVGAVPLSRKCLQSQKVRRSIGDGTDDQQALVRLIVEHNFIACNALTLEGYNGDAMQVTLKPVERTTVLTVPHSQERIELLSQAKTHGNIFAATGGVHLTANDIFKGIVLKQRKVERGKLTREKTVRERQEKNEMNAKIIQAAKGGDVTKLTLADLGILLTWYQHANIAKMNKPERLAVWEAIVSSGRAPPSYKRWTEADDANLLEAQSDVVKMAHTALGHLEDLKKKELVLAAMAMSNEEFDRMVAQRNQLIVESSDDPNQPPELIVHSTVHLTATTGNTASIDTSGDGGGVVGGENGL
jgi:hypothetical protein